VVRVTCDTHGRLSHFLSRSSQVVRPETLLVRPFIVCAVLRGVSFDAARYNSFIDLQDKLHQNICRKRTLVAIGTHDLSTVKGPFTYEALPPEDIRFVPLKQEREFSAAELMEYYKGDQKLKAFLPILDGSLVFPVIYDAQRTVLSLPPIINGAHSAISLDTRDVFIECTATDLTKAHIVLNMVVTMFSQYSAAPFTVEGVEVVDALGQTTITPDLADRQLVVDMEYVNRCTGALRTLPCRSLSSAGCRLVARLHPCGAAAGKNAVTGDARRRPPPRLHPAHAPGCAARRRCDGGRGNSVRVQLHPAERSQHGYDRAGAAAEHAQRSPAPGGCHGGLY